MPSSDVIASAVDAAEALRLFEQQISRARSAAYAAGAALQRAETDGGLSPLASRRMFAALTASQGGLDTALVHCSEAHRRAVRLADIIGIDPVSYGGQTWEDDGQPHRRG